MAKTKLDPVHIAQYGFDEDLEAHRVHILPHDMEFNLSADSGDSILTQKQMLVLEVQPGQIIDTSKHSKVAVACDTEVTLTAVISNNDYSLGTVGLHPIALCVPHVKADKACTIILQS